jgi:hypothetical protein
LNIGDYSIVETNNRGTGENEQGFIFVVEAETNAHWRAWGRMLAEEIGEIWNQHGDTFVRNETGEISYNALMDKSIVPKIPNFDSPWQILVMWW